MAGTLQKEERMILELLRVSLNKGEKIARTGIPGEDEKEFWEKVIRLAGIHAVKSLMYDTLCEEKLLTDALLKSVESSSRITVRTNYRLLFLTKYVTEFLEQNGIKAITLKGAATATLYPVPELRKAGDVDILITEDEACAKACRLLQQEGYQYAGEQLTLHHMELKSEEGISIEVHGLLAEPFDSQSVNQYLKKLLPEYDKHTVRNDDWGFPLYQPSDGYHAFYLILHMLQHFLRAGFGLKNLCDWVVFWNRDVEEPEKEVFVKMVKESGTEGFVELLTAACVRYLGLKRERAGFLLKRQIPEEELEEFMKEIFEAGEFGKSENNRMVVMRGTGIRAYVREFHHQMRLNYPKAGKIFLLWPVLWVKTLYRFVRNNHTVRGVSGREILKKAARRSELVERMRLFESMR